jgi:hypothetical protein
MHRSKPRLQPTFGGIDAQTCAKEITATANSGQAERDSRLRTIDRDLRERAAAGLQFVKIGDHSPVHYIKFYQCFRISGRKHLSACLRRGKRRGKPR